MPSSQGIRQRRTKPRETQAGVSLTRMASENVTPNTDTDSIGRKCGAATSIWAQQGEIWSRDADTGSARRKFGAASQYSLRDPKLRRSNGGMESADSRRRPRTLFRNRRDVLAGHQRLEQRHGVGVRIGSR